MLKLGIVYLIVHILIVDLRWEMTLKLDFGVRSTVEIGPSRKLFFQFCIRIDSAVDHWKFLTALISRT